MRKTIILDDTDGTDNNVETLTFSVRGTHYEIDLAEHNRQRFDAQLSEWITHARKTKTPTSKPRKTRTRKTPTPTTQPPENTNTHMQEQATNNAHTNTPTTTSTPPFNETHTRF